MGIDPIIFRVGTGKRPCVDGSGHFRAARRKIATPQDAPSLALVMGVHRHDKRLKFSLHNSCTFPEQRLFAQKWGVPPEPSLLIPKIRL